MADTAQPTPTDATVKAPEAPAVVAQADANVAASGKGFSDVQTAISGPAGHSVGQPGEGTALAGADKGMHAGHDNPSDSYDAFADFASHAWHGPPEGTALAKGDQGREPTSGHLDFAAADAGQTASAVDVHDGKATVTNHDVAATGDGKGNDTVSENATGEKYSRNAKNEVTETTKDQTTTIGAHEVETRVAGVDLKRRLDDDPAAAASERSALTGGQALQTKDSYSYRPKSDLDPNGGSLATAKTDGTTEIDGKKGDKLVISADKQSVDYTNTSGQTEHMTMAQFEKARGKNEFAGWNLNNDGSITSVHDNVNLLAKPAQVPDSQAAANATNPPPEAVGSATLTKVDPTDGSKLTASVSSDGKSQETHTASDGSFLSGSKGDYNNPGQAYQEVNSQGQAISTYNDSTGSFQGNGFSFNASGMQISDGGVAIGDNGTYSTDGSDSINSDGSLSYTSADGSIIGQYSYTPTQQQSTDVTTDVQSQLLAGDLDVDQLMALEDLTGGKINLTPQIDKALKKEEWADRRADKQDRLGSDATILDFSENIYSASSAA